MAAFDNFWQLGSAQEGIQFNRKGAAVAPKSDRSVNPAHPAS